MTALITAVFLASILGSLHCAGMCGGLMALAVGLADDGEAQPACRWRLHAGYHGGRLVTYSLLGALAGALGAALDFGGGMLGVQRAAAVFAGAVIVGFGVCALLKSRGVAIPRLPLPGPFQRLLTRAHRAAFSLPPMTRATVIGLLTTLLPCGWLYAFAITAAGTASPIWGVATMAIFWLGTLPVMVSLGAGVHLLMGVFGRRMPLVTGFALVAVGIFTVSERLLVPQGAFAAMAERDHEIDVLERVRALDSSEMPCCSTGGTSSAAPIGAEGTDR